MDDPKLFSTERTGPNFLVPFFEASRNVVEALGMDSQISISFLS